MVILRSLVWKTKNTDLDVGEATGGLVCRVLADVLMAKPRSSRTPITTPRKRIRTAPAGFRASAARGSSPHQMSGTLRKRPPTLPRKRQRPLQSKPR
jgi:hypothetical protein